MKRRMFLGFGVAAVAMMLSGCGGGSSNTYRFKVKVEAETPDGPAIGSSVLEGKIVTNSGGGVLPSVRGEAVAVDLPGGRTMFALLRSGNDSNWAGRVMMLLEQGVGGSADQVLARVKAMRGEQALPRMWPVQGILPRRSAYPTLVTFGDLDDPTSVVEVDPDDLAATFGEGYALKRITVQVTDEALTDNIEDRLAWVTHAMNHNYSRDGSFSKKYTSYGLYFKRGF